MRITPVFNTSLLLLGISSPVLADSNTSQDEVLTQEINNLYQKFTVLEKRASTSWVNNLIIGAFIQADARYFGDDGTGTDTFLIRRARIDVRGKINDNFSFRVLPEFGDDKNGELLDAYVDWKTGDSASLRIGKFKSPLGLERVQSGSRLLFLERGLTDNLVPNRDAGIAWNYKNKVQQVTIGIANNAGDRIDSGVDNDDTKVAYARIYSQPESLGGLGIGIAGSVGRSELNSALPTYKTSSRATVFRYNNDVLRDGTEARIAPHFTYYKGQFGAFGEYVSSSLTLTNSQNQQAVISNNAWQLVGSWMLSGEKNSWGTVTPKSKNGAWEVVARLAELDIDEDVFIAHADSTHSISNINSVTLGLNWHVNNKVKVLVNYEISDFDDGNAVGQDRLDEKLLSARLQLNF
ncbi:OprO/OprP family phosphate-selective porin [Colwellia ponticola]|uniref:Porin n=1 Tax=Colwellia ponticola TaxID=2304625 RepID=A0A8H2PMJ8_9GAMM|nr:porin [Colwellia ponticola]TMM46522.1 hypothetical protein FCS21_06100 [Colwellia ponticola]